MNKKPGKFLKRYKFCLLLLVISLAILFISPETGKEIFSHSSASLLEMLSIIPPVFMLLGLMDVWVPRETMMRYMGREAGLKGAIFAFVLGSFSAGPLYAAFPVAAVFLKKGVSLTNTFLFLGAWSTAKIPLMLFEITQLGWKFTLTRFFMNLAGIVVLAVIMERTTGKEEAAAIYETACSQLDEKKL